MRGLCSTQRLLIQRIQSSMQRLEEADRHLGSLHTVLPERELIKLPNALPVVLAQRVEEFKGLDQVHRPDHHVVVPAAEVVIDIDREKAARIDAQLRGVGGCLQAVRGMAEVEQNSQIVESHLLYREQGAGGVREDDLVPRFARLVLDHEVDFGMSPDQLTQPIDCQLPDIVVVHLEG